MEPEILWRGKQFHNRVQADWLETAEGSIHREHSIWLSKRCVSGSHVRRGRLDIFIDEIGDMVTVVEIKSTDWDRVKPKNRRRLLSAHRRQVCRYVDEYLTDSKDIVCASIIYPLPPCTNGLRFEIETYLNDEGIQVVWYDE